MRMAPGAKGGPEQTLARFSGQALLTHDSQAPHCFDILPRRVFGVIEACGGSPPALAGWRLRHGMTQDQAAAAAIGPLSLCTLRRSCSDAHITRVNSRVTAGATSAAQLACPTSSLPSSPSTHCHIPLSRPVLAATITSHTVKGPPPPPPPAKRRLPQGTLMPRPGAPPLSSGKGLPPCSHCCHLPLPQPWAARAPAAPAPRPPQSTKSIGGPACRCRPTKPHAHTRTSAVQHRHSHTRCPTRRGAQAVTRQLSAIAPLAPRNAVPT